LRKEVYNLLYGVRKNFVPRGRLRRREGEPWLRTFGEWEDVNSKD